MIRKAGMARTESGVWVIVRKERRGGRKIEEGIKERESGGNIL